MGIVETYITSTQIEEVYKMDKRTKRYRKANQKLDDLIIRVNYEAYLCNVLLSLTKREKHYIRAYQPFLDLGLREDGLGNSLEERADTFKALKAKLNLSWQDLRNLVIKLHSLL